MRGFDKAAGPMGSAQEQMAKPKETAPLSHRALHLEDASSFY